MGKITLKKTYCKHWWATMKEFELSPTEVLTIDLIDGLSRRKGWCYASRKSMANTLNISIPTLRSAIEKLINKELLTKGWTPYKAKVLKPTRKWRKLIEQLSAPFE